MDEHLTTIDLPRFFLDVDMYVAKYAYAISVVSGAYTTHTTLQVQQLDEWLYQARTMVLASGASLDSTFYGLCQDKAADIVVSIKQHVQEQRDGYEVLQIQWPKWKEILLGSVNESRGINRNETRPTEVTL